MCAMDMMRQRRLLINMRQIKSDKTPIILLYCLVIIPLLFQPRAIYPDKTEYKEKRSVRDEVIYQAGQYGVEVATALKIAECESGLNATAKNPRSTAKGVYQFIDGTWAYIKATGHQYDYEENIRQFMQWFPRYPNWWRECIK